MVLPKPKAMNAPTRSNPTPRFVGPALRRSLTIISGLLLVMMTVLAPTPGSVSVRPIFAQETPAEAGPVQSKNTSEAESDSAEADAPTGTGASQHDDRRGGAREDGAASTQAESESESESDSSSKPAAVPSARQASSVAVITIEGMIDQVTVDSIERRLNEANAAGHDGVVFEIDTFGGQAAAALEICEIIKGSPITKTTAWVRPKAYSAGTFIALACNEIVIAPNGTIGDCAPVLPGMIPIPAAERAKIESPLLEEVMDSAARNGYDAKLLISFVAVDMELWLVRHRESGRYRFVDRTEYRKLFEEEPPEDIRMQGSGGIPTGDQQFEEGNPAIERFVPPGRSAGPRGGGSSESDGEPPSLDERISEASRQLTRSPVAQPLTDEDVGQYELVEPVINAKELLVLKTPRALRYNLAKKEIVNDRELMDFLGANSVTRYNRTWSEGLVRLLTSMPMRILLVLVFAVGLVWEMSTPGVGVPGSIGAVALIILLGAPALSGMAQWWDIMFVLIGLALIAVEVFIIPGFGIAGILGVLVLGLGFVGTFIAPDPGGGLLPSSPEAQQQALRGLLTLLVAVFGGTVGVYFLYKQFNTLPVLSRLVLSTNSNTTEDVSTTMLTAMAPVKDDRPKRGAVGAALTPLRPSGRARFDGRVFEVVSGHGIIEPNEEIIVKSADAFSIVVEKKPTDERRHDHDSPA